MKWDREFINNYYREYRKMNPEQTKKTTKKWYDKNIEKNPNYNKLKHKKNKVNRNKGVKDYRKNRRLQLMNYLCNGNICCQKCSYKEDLRALHFDHINGDGNKQRKLHGTDMGEIVYYTKHLDEARAVLQVLCVRCNWLKRYE